MRLSAWPTVRPEVGNFSSGALSFIQYCVHGKISVGPSSSTVSCG